MQTIDKLAWIEIQNKSILSTRTKGKNTYYIPDGKREIGESDHDALVREIKEELSVDILEDTIKYMGTFQAQAHGYAEGVLVKMQCCFGKYTGELKPAAEIEEMIWLNTQHMDIIAPVDKIIFKWLKDRDMIK